jgi:hypothetical protein
VAESLLELAQLTGDNRWRELAEVHWKFATRLTPQVDGQLMPTRGW